MRFVRRVLQIAIAGSYLLVGIPLTSSSIPPNFLSHKAFRASDSSGAPRGHRRPAWTVRKHIAEKVTFAKFDEASLSVFGLSAPPISGKIGSTSSPGLLPESTDLEHIPRGPPRVIDPS